MLKRFLSVILGFAVLATCVRPVGAVGVPYEYCNIIKLTVGSKTAYVNGKPVLMKTISPPYIKLNRFIVPLRFVAENLDASVTWDAFMKGRTDVETGDGIIVEFKNGDKRFYVGDLNHRIDTHANAGWVKKLMDPAPVIKKDDRMYVPIRYLAEGIDASLSFDEKTKTVTIRRIDTKGWKEYVQPYTGTKIRYPYDWKIETQGFGLDIFKNGTEFIFTYESGSNPRDVINSAKNSLLNTGWKVSKETGSYITLTKTNYDKHLIKIVSTRKLTGGSLVFTVNTNSWASEWDLLIIDKITPGAGI